MQRGPADMQIRDITYRGNFDDLEADFFKINLVTEFSSFAKELFLI